jgi:hypothetical protein
VRRHKLETDSVIGHDSFLDVVANIVGILIVLVIVAGLRARNAPVEAASLRDDLQPLAAEVEKQSVTQRQLYGDVMRIARQMELVQQEAAVRQIERNRLATIVAAMEHELQSRRGQLDASAQDNFDLKRGLADARRQLDQFEQQGRQATAAAPETTVIESYPTPLGKPVDENEAHFQLRGGRIVFVPLGDLVERFQLDARRQLYKLIDVPELTETIGPIEGFRMQYTLERYDEPVATRTATGKGAYARLKRWTIIPQSNQLGETIDEALAEGSAFRDALTRTNPRKMNITIWTYPDSFDDFRRIKKELFRLGFSTAGRPLPEGLPISGSPEGTKSLAE